MDDNFEKDIEFIKLLRENNVTTPNDFSIEMGKLIKSAREERGYSQADFAEKINRRPATISHIENGKSDISISTLVLLAIELQKPISYFFPETIFKNTLLDVKSEFEHQVLEIFRNLSLIHEEDLAFKVLQTIEEYYEDVFDQISGSN